MRLTATVSGLFLGFLLLLAAGCETAPDTAAKSPFKPVVAAKPAVSLQAQPKLADPMLAPNIQLAPSKPIHPPKLSKQTKALVTRFTDSDDPDALPHEVSDTTSFPGALVSLQPGATAPKLENFDNTSQPPPRGLTADGNSTALVEQDWTGLVLVPISKSLSKAHTSDVRLTKVEAHPLTDGRVRIWTRVQNIGNQVLPTEIACEFRLKGVHLTSPYFYELDVPPNGFRDVFFVSPDGDLNSYTVLVRSTDTVENR